MKPFSWVQDRIRQLAAENPDRTANCVYFTDNTEPCCIVGHVIGDLGARFAQRQERGLQVTELVNTAGETLGEGFVPAKDIDWPSLGVEAPKGEQARWVQDVQDTQDTGTSWGAAVEMADAQ